MCTCVACYCVCVHLRVICLHVLLLLMCTCVLDVMCVPALCTFVHGVLTCAINTCGVLLNVYVCCMLMCLCTFARYMLTCAVVVDVHVCS